MALIISLARVKLCSLLYFAAASLFAIVRAEDPYRFFDWNVTYGDIYPLGVRQQGILINGQFPGPDIHSVTNDNLIINVYNSLDEPFLLSWNGIQNRRNSFEDGVWGTTCPIPPGKNFTYILQVKDQIGSFYYFPSLAFHKAAGGFGGIRILSRPRIPVPFPDPAGDYTVLIGDWYKSNHTTEMTERRASQSTTPVSSAASCVGDNVDGQFPPDMDIFTDVLGPRSRYKKGLGGCLG
ncbi:L-ascorbate oxidase homolog isoform X2 [Humulus lupulus]|uniref:L-ascorbate oxidase homolog isoform X2 n=1 Tax=Humulus lupulus TaxID=3486 RepID=UPI002B40CC63|nr:L-ascorbate oxidase homolog isoform X2 [Humulus lupulus]